MNFSPADITVRLITFGIAERLSDYSAIRKGPITRRTILTIPGIANLFKEIKTLEDYARACHSREELQMMIVTQEEAEVLDSFRRFKIEDYE